MAIVCNRLDITGDVSERTPLIVIKEIMLAHHIVWEENRTDPNYIRGCIKSIYTYPAYRVDIPLSTNGRNTLKRYLDVSDEEWSNEELIQVYQIWNDIISRISNGIPIEYIGRPTRSCPKSLNACFLYRICNEKGIELPFNISLDNLAVIAKLSEGGNVRSFIEIINSVLLRGDSKEILPFIATTPLRYLGAYTVPRAYIQSETVTHEMLKTLTGNQVFMRNRRNVSPQNNTEAIALAANNYNINLFYAANPLREYFEIRSYPGDLGGRYTPSDIDMKHIYNKNPNLIKLTTFDPRIPSNFYNNTILCSAIENEGYTRQELSSEDPYELLQIAFLSETFHAGWYPNISNTNTPFLYLDVDELSTNDILCFGCRSDELIALTFSEVAGMFRSSGNFINNIREPSGGFLSNLSIRKLRKICLSSSSPAARDCIREIDAIESLVSTGSENLLSFCETYLSVSEDRKENIKIILKKLFDLSMYMRGWDGHNTEFPPIDTHLSQVEIDLNVTSAVNSFENSLETSGFNTLIKGLPIFKYTSGRFFVSNTPDEGVTLGERLNLMKRGDSDDNINSCIRLTSNWFAASAYRYYQVLRLPLPFEIENLRWIS